MRMLLPALLVGIALPGGARAQTPGGAPAGADRQCRYISGPAGVTSGAGDVVTLQAPFEVRCTDGTEVRASSGVVDRLNRIVNLNGNVFFQDSSRTLTSEQAIYEINVGRLYAIRNVVFTDRVEGTTLRGPELEYFSVMEGRPEALVNATGRPHLTLLRPPPPDAPPPESSPAPLEIDGDRMTIIGQNNLSVLGNVLIEDANMRAIAEEAEHRGLAETLELRGNAEIHSREYSLTGQTIFARIPGGSLRDVEARGGAKMFGEALDVAAPGLDLYFENDLLQRSVARSDSALAPGQRPVATSPTFRLEADSIDASLPGQRLQMVVAIGQARGETIDTTRVEPIGAMAPGDSAGPGAGGPPAADAAALAEEAELAQETGLAEGADTSAVTAAARRAEAAPSTGAELVENDWIVGDTITGYFTSVAAPAPDSAVVAQEGVDVAVVSEAPDPASAPDTTVVMERLVALGEARSLYHVAPEAGSPPGTRPGINFVSASMIELRFADGQVQVAEVSGLRRGLYLEPLATAPSALDEDDEPTPAGGADDPAGEADAPDPDPSVPEPAQIPTDEPGENQ